MVSKDSINKFTPEGEALDYKGNTIISIMNDESYPIYEVAKKVIKEASKEGFVDKLKLLPASSMHMTIISLLRDIDRDTDKWPSYLDRNASWEEIDKTLYEKIISEVKPLDEVYMCVQRVDDVGIKLAPYSDKDKSELTRFRNEIADKLEIKHEGHDDYQFHMSYAYRVKDYTDQEEKEVEEYSKRVSKMAVDSIGKFKIADPKFVVFNDMLSYHDDLSRSE